MGRKGSIEPGRKGKSWWRAERRGSAPVRDFWKRFLLCQEAELLYPISHDSMKELRRIPILQSSTPQLREGIFAGTQPPGCIRGWRKFTNRQELHHYTNVLTINKKKKANKKWAKDMNKQFSD